MRSRKKLIWILVPVGIVIALLITVIIMRHEIMGHALTIAISKKTNQQVTLYLDSVDFRILSSTVYLKNAVFSFNNLALNEKKTLELEELRFGEIKMSGISALRLLFFRRIKANSLVVSEPSSRMKSTNNVESQPVPPNEIIEQIQNNSSVFGKLKIQIEDVHIRAGHFRMEKMDFDKNSMLDFDYGINLHQFDTRLKLLKDTTRLFFSDEMLIRLKNIRYANPSGESLFTDSLILSSGSTWLDIYGVRVNPSTTQQTASTSISGDIQHIRLEGGDITFPSNAIDFRLQSISLSQGNLVIFKHRAEKVTDTIQLNALANAIRSISINNLNFDDCNVLMISPENDTLLRADLDNLKWKNMVADSGFQQNSEKISFDDLSWSTGELSYLERENKIRIQVRSTRFMETTGKLNLENTLVYNPSADETLSYDIKISALEVDGLYIRKLLSQQDLSLSFTLNQPEIKVSEKGNRTSKKRFSSGFQIPAYLTLNTLNIHNGNLKYNKAGELSIETKGIQFYSGNLSINNLADLKTCDFSQISMQTDQGLVQITKNAVQLQWDRFTLKNTVAGIDLVKLNVGDLEQITLEKIRINQPDFNALAEGKRIKTGQILCVSPVFSGTIDLRKKQGEETQANSPVKDLSPVFSTKGFTIQNGQVSTRLVFDTDTLQLSTHYTLNTAAFSLPSRVDENWLGNLQWSLTLNQSQLHHRLISAKAAGVLINTEEKTLKIKQLQFDDHDKPISEVGLNELVFESLSVNELDFKQLIVEKTLNFGTLLVENPRVDLSLFPPGRNRKMKSEPEKPIDFNQLPFTFKEVIFQNMSLNIEKIDSTNGIHVGFEKMDLNLNFPSAASTNLTDHLQLDISGITLNDQLKKQQLTIHQIHYDPSIHSLNINGLSGIQNQQKTEGDTSKTLMSYTLESIYFTGFNISKSLPAVVSIQKIYLSNPFVSYQHSQPGLQKETPYKTRTKKISLPKVIGQLTIDTLLFSDLNFQHIIPSGSGRTTNNFKDLTIHVHNIHIDTTGLSADNFSFVESTRIELGNNKLISSDSLYSTQVTAINYNFALNSLTLDSLKMKPRYTEETFFKKAVYQTDMTQVTTHQVVCSEIRLQEFIKTGELHIGSVDIYGLNAGFYRDKRFPMDPHAYKKMPQQLMLDVKSKFLIDSLKTHDASIHYKEIVEKAKEPGTIFLDGFDLSLFHLTNIPRIIQSDSIAKANLRAKVMGKTDLRLNLFLNLASPRHEFWFTGFTQSIDFSELNSVTQNLVGINMEQGEGRVLMPIINGDSSHTNGHVVFLYKKLRVGLYNREKATSTTGLARGMANVLLNDIVIKSNNPGFLRKPKTGVVYFDRDVEKSFVYYVWKSVLSGMLSTFGINTRDQRQEKRDLKNRSQ